MTVRFFPIPAPPPARLSTMPRPLGGDQLDESLRALRAAGVDILVSLLTVAEQHGLELTGEAAAAERAGLAFHSFPIGDFGIPDREKIRPLLDTLETRLAAGAHVAVHCHAGIGRSSLVAGALLVRLGTPVESVWDVISTARGRRVPETDLQRRWLQVPAVGSPG